MRLSKILDVYFFSLIPIDVKNIVFCAVKDLIMPKTIKYIENTPNLFRKKIKKQSSKNRTEMICKLESIHI